MDSDTNLVSKGITRVVLAENTPDTQCPTPNGLPPGTWYFRNGKPRKFYAMANQPGRELNHG